MKNGFFLEFKSYFRMRFIYDIVTKSLPVWEQQFICPALVGTHGAPQ